MVYIREFLKDDAKDAAAIWNKVVEDGVAFPQLETLSPKEAENFLQHRILPESHLIPKPEKWQDFISFTQTT